MVILDTSIIIDHLRRKVSEVFININERYGLESIGISVVTIQELYAGKSTQNKAQEDEMTEIIMPLNIFEYNYETAQIAGELSRDHRNYMQFADAAIAATCIQNKAELATLNTKHFKDIPDLALIDIDN